MTLFSIGSFSIELLIFEKKINSPLVSALKKIQRVLSIYPSLKTPFLVRKNFGAALGTWYITFNKIFKN